MFEEENNRLKNTTVDPEKEHRERFWGRPGELEESAEKPVGAAAEKPEAERETYFAERPETEMREHAVETAEPEMKTYHIEEPVAEKKKAKKKVRKERKSSGILKKLLTAACVGLCFGIFAGGGVYAVMKITGWEIPTAATDPQPEQVQIKPVSTPTLSTYETLSEDGTVKVITSDVSDMVDSVMPAMVSIVKDYTTISESFWGQQFSEDRQGSGSGIIVAQSDTELILVTNYHVVSEAKKLTVTFVDGSTAEAQIKGNDADMDLAVIAIPLDRLTNETKEAIAIAKLGDSDNLRLGSPVIAIGNALGYGQSVTGGYISALNREVNFDDGGKGTFIQTDAAINPGNSGGALVNIYGEVIGINSSKRGGTYVEGMGYAIPISKAKPIIEELMTKTTRTKVEDGKTGYMGVSLQTITEEAAYMYGMPGGILVRDVIPGSAADKAGMKKLDVITRFEGEKLTSYNDLENILQYYGPGTEVTVIVQRQVDGEYKEVKLTLVLDEKPEA